MRTRTKIAATAAAITGIAAGVTAWRIPDVRAWLPGGSSSSAGYQPDRRPLVFTGALTNRGPGWPEGELPGWTAGDVEAIYDVINRGAERTVLRAIVKPDTGGLVPFPTWHPLSDVQRAGLLEAVRRWKAEQHGRSIGLFFRREATDPFVRRSAATPEGPYLALDPADPTAWRYWLQNIAEPLEFIDEVWLDGGSADCRPELREAIVTLARRMRADYGVKVGVEAIPGRCGQDGNPDWSLGPDWQYIAEVPALAHWRFIWWRYIRTGHYEVLDVPAELRDRVEVHVLLHPGRPSPPEPFDWPPPTQADVRRLRHYGWTISYLHTIFEPEPGPSPEPGPPDPKPEPRP